MEDNKWSKFLKELSNLYFLWFFGIIFFFLFRVLFITFFHQHTSTETNFLEYWKVFFMGFKFDSTVISYFIILPFLSLLILSYFNLFKFIKSLRIFIQYLFVIASSTIGVITINYFKEYNNQFNNFLFLALYDDQKAVLKTVIKDFNPIANLLILIITILFSLLILNKFEKKQNIYNQLKRLKINKAFFILLTTVFLFIALRGSVTKRPVMRKWAAVSTDHFLNKTILNPFIAYKYALKDFRRVNLLDGNNKFLSNSIFLQKFQKPFVTDFLKKKTKGPMVKKPKQVFLIIMESYDSWPLMDKYLPFNLSSNLSNAGKNGIQFSNFLPASYSTFNSYATIITGIPYCGINIGYLGGINDPYKTSIFKQFKKLGYQTNMYYGGFLSWDNIGEFTSYQGADALYSGANVGGKSDSGDWGVEDEKIFNLAIKQTKESDFSLNVILTSSYHPPYNIDLKKNGFPYQSKKDIPAKMEKYYDNGMTIKQMGHLWYGDKAIGEFIKKASKKFPEAIFCFTGDHFGRRFVNFQPNLYERSSVNFIIYGNGIPKTQSKTPGSHVDIIPTLIEMIAPKEFEYYSFGESLFNDQKDSGFMINRAITKYNLYHFRNDKKIDAIDLNNMKDIKIDRTIFKDKIKNRMALAWHYIMKGDSIK